MKTPNCFAVVPTPLEAFSSMVDLACDDARSERLRHLHTSGHIERWRKEFATR